MQLSGHRLVHRLRLTQHLKLDAIDGLLGLHAPAGILSRRHLTPIDRRQIGEGEILLIYVSNFGHTGAPRRSGDIVGNKQSLLPNRKYLQVFDRRQCRDGCLLPDR